MFVNPFSKDISLSICLIFLQRFLQAVDGMGNVELYDGIQPMVSNLGNAKDGCEAEQNTVPEVSRS